MLNRDFSVLRSVVIQEIIHLTREKYVFPEKGEEIAATLQARLEQGAYQDISTENELAQHLTNELRSISGDWHWSVVYDPHKIQTQVDPENEVDKAHLAGYLDMARKKNFGFEVVKRLRGNVGYIDLRSFEPSEYGGETAVAAMNFIANCDALIFDLRRNHGGYPSMVQLITSYLLEAEPRHINSFYYRPTGNIQQFWTFPHVPGKRVPDIPVYLLTSSATGSGAEEFAYNLKHMGRATLVGETTAGAAHPVTKEVVQGIFDVRLPYGRPVNPITQENWERVGVEPDVITSSEEALKTAHLLALQSLIEKCQSGADRFYLDWIMEIVASDYSPGILDDAALVSCAGVFGKRVFSVEDGVLVYGHQELPLRWKLTPMTRVKFHLDEDMKFEFVFDEAGSATTLVISYLDGRPAVRVERLG